LGRGLCSHLGCCVSLSRIRLFTTGALGFFRHGVNNGLCGHCLCSNRLDSFGTRRTTTRLGRPVLSRRRFWAVTGSGIGRNRRIALATHSSLIFMPTAAPTAATAAAAAAFPIAIALCSLFASFSRRLGLTVLAGLITFCLQIAIAITAATPPTTATISTTAIVIIAPFIAPSFFDLVLIFILCIEDKIVKRLFHNRFVAGAEGGGRATRIHCHPRALKLAVGLDINHDAIARFNLAQLGTLAVKHVKGGFLAGAQHQLAPPAARGFFFQHPQGRKARR
jgi:hypothetical protein